MVHNKKYLTSEITPPVIKCCKFLKKDIPWDIFMHKCSNIYTFGLYLDKTRFPLEECTKSFINYYLL